MYAHLVSLLITVPYLIVDNRDDYPKTSNERVVMPGQSLGWAGAAILDCDLRCRRVIPAQ